jgi:hypothetical protein
MASAATALECGLYLYGITGAEGAAGDDACGVEGTPVEAIVEFGLAAMVSRLPVRRLRPQRANLAAHHRVLKDLAGRQAVLPVAFGTMAADERQLRLILRKRAPILRDLLDRLENKVEMGLKVYWETGNIFDYFVATHQELEAMRNRLFRPGRQPTVEEKIELGRLFGTLLQQSRERHTRRVTEALAPYCAEVRAIDPGEEQMIMKLACLVDHDRRQQWEEGVYQVARLFDDHYRFSYSGPWPPYNFANIDLRAADSEESFAEEAQAVEG